MPRPATDFDERMRNDCMLFIQLWISAAARLRNRVVDLAERSLDEDGINPHAPYLSISSQAESYVFVMALHQVRMGALLVQRAMPASSDALTSALANFDQAAPDIKAVRDALMHFDEYVSGIGRMHRRHESPSLNISRHFGVDYDPEEMRVHMLAQIVSELVVQERAESSRRDQDGRVQQAHRHHGYPEHCGWFAARRLQQRPGHRVRREEHDRQRKQQDDQALVGEGLPDDIRQAGEVWEQHVADHRQSLGQLRGPEEDPAHHDKRESERTPTNETASRSGSLIQMEAALDDE
jgi:hypothetical protein